MFSFCGFETFKSETDIFPFSAVLKFFASRSCVLLYLFSVYEMFTLWNVQISLSEKIKPVNSIEFENKHIWENQLEIRIL